jgi:hypothetical protein
MMPLLLPLLLLMVVVLTLLLLLLVVVMMLLLLLLLLVAAGADGPVWCRQEHLHGHPCNAEVSGQHFWPPAAVRHTSNA